MELLGRYSAWLEVYSIDEAFLGENGSPAELLAMGLPMKDTVRRKVAMPVRVGIAATDTVAKLMRTTRRPTTKRPHTPGSSWSNT